MSLITHNTIPSQFSKETAQFNRVDRILHSQFDSSADMIHAFYSVHLLVNQLVQGEAHSHLISEIDVLLVFTNRIVVLELKAWSGSLDIGNTTNAHWIVNTSQVPERKSAFYQISLQRKYLMDHLIPNCASLGMGKVIIDAAVVFQDGFDFSRFEFTDSKDYTETDYSRIISGINSIELQRVAMESFIPMNTAQGIFYFLRPERIPFDIHDEVLRALHENGVEPRTKKWLSVLHEGDLTQYLNKDGYSKLMVTPSVIEWFEQLVSSYKEAA